MLGIGFWVAAHTGLLRRSTQRLTRQILNRPRPYYALPITPYELRISVKHIALLVMCKMSLPFEDYKHYVT